MSPKLPSGELRKVILVGHDVKQDIALLESIDFDVYEMRNLLEVVDNQKLHQHRHRFYNGQGLSAVLAGLDISYMYLHNAGNDAVYTLQSLIRLAIIKRQESLARSPKDKSALVPTYGVESDNPSYLTDRPTNHVQVRCSRYRVPTQSGGRLEHGGGGHRRWRR